MIAALLTLLVLAAPAHATSIPAPPRVPAIVHDRGVPAGYDGLAGGAYYCPGVAPQYGCPAANVIHLGGGVGRFGRAHEFCHALDFQVLHDADRAVLRSIMHAPGGDWWRPYGAAEWFADYCAAVATDYDPRPHLVGNHMVGRERVVYAILGYKRIQLVRLGLALIAARDHLRVAVL